MVMAPMDVGRNNAAALLSTALRYKMEKFSLGHQPSPISYFKLRRANPFTTTQFRGLSLGVTNWLPATSFVFAFERGGFHGVISGHLGVSDRGSGGLFRYESPARILPGFRHLALFQTFFPLAINWINHDKSSLTGMFFFSRGASNSKDTMKEQLQSVSFDAVRSACCDSNHVNPVSGDKLG